MKTYRIKLTKDQKEMIEGVLQEWIGMTKDNLRDEDEPEAVKELKQELKLMRETLKAVRQKD